VVQTYHLPMFFDTATKSGRKLHSTCFIAASALTSSFYVT